MNFFARLFKGSLLKAVRLASVVARVAVKANIDKEKHLDDEQKGMAADLVDEVTDAILDELEKHL